MRVQEEYIGVQEEFVHTLSQTTSRAQPIKLITFFLKVNG